MKWESTRKAYDLANELWGDLPPQKQAEEALLALFTVSRKAILTLVMCSEGAVRDIVREFRKAMREATERRKGKQ
ncbi:MAG: hypothetical protein PHS73_04855 [Candidatus Peribacteraceae bacterium]|nr:hypothetical protein [Candidatus Peribacteraceae bacterium]